MKPVILWDLDGTLTDPKEGILRSVQYALEKSGHVVPPMDDLLWCIGPPLHKSFAQLSPQSNEAQVWDLVAKYRERFSETGLYENKVYAGIPEALAHAAKTKRQFVATSKPWVFARKITDHFNLSKFFGKVYGSELDGVRSEKGDLILHLLEEEKISPKDALIIGDRKHDVLGARKAGIMSVGITWGYGPRAELQEAGADFIFDSPSELTAFLEK